MRGVLSSLIVSIAVLGAATSASAGPCSGNIQELCPEAMSGTETISCLRSREADLSKECNDYLAFFDSMPSCVSEADDLCGNASSGADILECLRSRQADLSPACKMEIQAIK